MAALVLAERVGTPGSRDLVAQVVASTRDESERARSTVAARDDGTRAQRPQKDEYGGATSVLMEALRESVAVSVGTGATALDEALASLRELLPSKDASEAEWLHAARLLRRAAVERRHSAPRVASVALLLSDALSFTDMKTVSSEGREPLREGFATLMQSFVSTDDERALLRGLLKNKWYVTAGFQPEAFAQAAI